MSKRILRAPSNISQNGGPFSTDVFDQEPLYLTARRDEQIVGVLPLVKFKSLLFGRSLVSVPYANYAGLLTSDAAASDALVREATTLGRAFGATHVELRNTSRHCRELLGTAAQGRRSPSPAVRRAKRSGRHSIERSVTRSEKRRKKA